MNSIKNLIACLIILINADLAHARYILVQDAAGQGLIECVSTGRWNRNSTEVYNDPNGQYFGKCMTMTLKSRADSTLLLSIPAGLMLLCEDTTTQDMIITREWYIQINPGEKKTLQLYAMCSEIHDNMPHKDLTFRIGEMADRNLVSIVTTIEAMFMQNIVGQDAVWAYTDNATEHDVRRYGATDASLALTRTLLDRGGVLTPLNPKAEAEVPPGTQPIPELVPYSIPPTDILVPASMLHGGLIVIFLLLTTSIVLLIRNKRNKRSDVS